MKVAVRVRRIAAMGLAGCLLYGGSMQTSAATLKDVFDEHYYADSNEDLKEAFGYDREALWTHFITYGLKEARNMNGMIDIVKYRNTYEDLNAAFGDDWDAYLEHYLTFGAKERRESGTGFSPLDYAERYTDLHEAFGENVLELWQHYQTFGVTENREGRDESIVSAEKEAEEADRRQGEEQASQGTSQTGAHTERINNPDGSGWHIKEYDDRGVLFRITTYRNDGSVREVDDMDGARMKKSTYYDEKGNKTSECVYGEDYGKDGNRSRVVISYEYDEEGNLTGWSDHTYGSSGVQLGYTMYDANGNKTFESVLGKDGKITTSYMYDEEGNLVSSGVTEYDADGNRIKTTYYDAEGNVTSVSEYDKDHTF